MAQVMVEKFLEMCRSDYFISLVRSDIYFRTFIGDTLSNEIISIVNSLNEEHKYEFIKNIILMKLDGIDGEKLNNILDITSISYGGTSKTFTKIDDVDLLILSLMIKPVKKIDGEYHEIIVPSRWLRDTSFIGINAFSPEPLCLKEYKIIKMRSAGVFFKPSVAEVIDCISHEDRLVVKAYEMMDNERESIKRFDFDFNKDDYVECDVRLLVDGDSE